MMFDFGLDDSRPRKKRNLTAAQKVYHWENNAHTCNICLKSVSKFSDAEFDHTRAFSKGGATNGTNVKIVHRQCNRLKGDKSLGETRRMLGIKAPAKKASSKKRVAARPKKKAARRRASDDFGLGGLFGF